MNDEKKLLLKSYLNNLNVNIITTDYTHCWATWRDIDFVPEYNQFYYICDGEGWIKYGDEEYYPKRKQLLLLPAGVMQSYSTINENTFKKYWCHFTATVGDMNLFDIIKLPRFIDVKDEKVLGDLFCKLLRSFSSKDISATIRTKGILLEIISYYIENSEIKEINISTSKAIKKLNDVITYINGNYNADITNERLAAIMSLHPNYFIRFFKKHFGITPIQYVNKIRLEKAKYILREGNHSVTQTANIVGFNDVFYFSRVFKIYTGYSPSDFQLFGEK